jgi:hypothetical protein
VSTWLSPWCIRPCPAVEDSRGCPARLTRRRSAAAGFLARDWGEGSVTNQLHKVSFALHEELAAELGLTSYRRIPVLSISPGEKTKSTRTDLCPGWLDGDFAQARVMDADGGAQVAPLELCTKLADAAIANGATLRIGKVEGIRTRPPAVALAATDAAPEGVTAGMRTRSATAAAAGGTSSSESEPPREVCAVVVDGEEIECSAFVVTMGPWACLAQDWFDMPVSGPPAPISLSLYQPAHPRPRSARMPVSG